MTLRHTVLDICGAKGVTWARYDPSTEQVEPPSLLCEPGASLIDERNAFAFLAHVRRNDMCQPAGPGHLGRDCRQPVPAARCQHNRGAVPGVLPRQLGAESARRTDDENAETRPDGHDTVILLKGGEIADRIGGRLREGIWRKSSQTDHWNSDG